MYNIVDAIYQMVVSASWTMMIICYAFASNSDDHDNDGIMMMVDVGHGNDGVVDVKDAVIMRSRLRVNKGSRRRETQPPELQRSLSRWTGTMSVWSGSASSLLISSPSP